MSGLLGLAASEHALELAAVITRTSDYEAEHVPALVDFECSACLRLPHEGHAETCPHAAPAHDLERVLMARVASTGAVATTDAADWQPSLFDLTPIGRMIAAGKEAHRGS